MISCQDSQSFAFPKVIASMASLNFIFASFPLLLSASGFPPSSSYMAAPQAHISTLELYLFLYQNYGAWQCVVPQEILFIFRLVYARLEKAQSISLITICCEEYSFTRMLFSFMSRWIMPLGSDSLLGMSSKLELSYLTQQSSLNAREKRRKSSQSWMRSKWINIRTSAICSPIQNIFFLLKTCLRLLSSSLRLLYWQYSQTIYLRSFWSITYFSYMICFPPLCGRDLRALLICISISCSLS